MQWKLISNSFITHNFKTNFESHNLKSAQKTNRKFILHVESKYICLGQSYQSCCRLRWDFVGDIITCKIMEFKTGVTQLSVPDIPGVISSNEFSSIEDKLKRNGILKSYGLTDFEIKIHNDYKKGMHYVQNIHKNYEQSSLLNLLTDIEERIRVGGSNYDIKNKTNGNERMLCSSTLSHPINHLNDLKDDLFGHLESEPLPSVRKRRKFLRRMSRKLEKGSSIPLPLNFNRNNNCPESSSVNPYNDFIKSNNDAMESKASHTETNLNTKWDEKTVRKPLINNVSKYSINRKNIGCKQNTLYTIRNNKIVRLKCSSNDNIQSANYNCETVDIIHPMNNAEKMLLENTRLSIDDIKKIEKFQNYDPGILSKTLFVKNLSNNVNEYDLKKIFSNTEFSNIRVMTGKMKGQAFITFDAFESASEALEKNNGVYLKGKPIIIQYGKK